MKWLGGKGVVCQTRGAETFSLTPPLYLTHLLGRENGKISSNQWFNQSFLCNKPPKNPWGTGFRELPGWWTCEGGESVILREDRNAWLFPYALPSAFLPSGCSWIISFYNPLVIYSIKCFWVLWAAITKESNPWRRLWASLVYSRLVRSVSNNPGIAVGDWWLK